MPKDKDGEAVAARRTAIAQVEQKLHQLHPVERCEKNKLNRSSTRERNSRPVDKIPLAYSCIGKLKALSRDRRGAKEDDSYII